MKPIKIGYLLSSNTTGFVAGCSVSQHETPTFGMMVRAPLDNQYSVYGLIYDIHIDDDGLVRQLVTAGNISAEVIHDNRERRIVPTEISVLAVGFEQGGSISHLLPPIPPLSLDIIYLCPDDELIKFTLSGKFGYFRHILRANEIPIDELLAAHIRQATAAHKDKTWFQNAILELIRLQRNDYPSLMSILSALGDALPT
jgi:hypothetical protein